jgi:hypothetical protein
MMTAKVRATIVLFLGVCWAVPAAAQVTRLEIESRAPVPPG